MLTGSRTSAGVKSRLPHLVSIPESKFGTRTRAVGGYVPVADVARGRSASLLLLHFSDGNDLRVGAEFLVVAKSDVVFEVEVFQQGESRVNLYVDVLRQPDFVIDTRLLNDNS